MELRTPSFCLFIQIVHCHTDALTLNQKNTIITKKVLFEVRELYTFNHINGNISR